MQTCSSIEGNCDILDDDGNSRCSDTVVIEGEVTTRVEDMGDYKTWMQTITVTAGAEKLGGGNAPTETAGDKPKETGGEEGGDKGEEEDDESAAAGLACGSLLAAVVAVGVVLI